MVVLFRGAAIGDRDGHSDGIRQADHGWVAGAGVAARRHGCGGSSWPPWLSA
jgi:hypothetical protein